MFKLYPSEELIIKDETNPRIDEQKKSRYLLITGIILILVAIFYRYASAQDWILTAVFWVSIVGAIISLGAYVYKLYNAGKEKGSLLYYVTSRRIVETDAEDNINREMLLSRVKRVDKESTVRKAGNVIINRKELSSQDEYKQRLKGSQEKQYAKETFVIKSITNVDKFAEAINK